MPYTAADLPRLRGMTREQLIASGALPREQLAAGGGLGAPQPPPVAAATPTAAAPAGPGVPGLSVGVGDDVREFQYPAFLGQWADITSAMQAAQRQALGGRIPGAGELETESSANIAALLNPAASFTDVNRRAAELAAGRGIAGSPVASEIGYRMTDEERLRRQALGQQQLSAAYARNPIAELIDPTRTYVTPYQQSQLELEARRLGLSEQELALQRERWNWERNRLEQPSFTYSGGGGGGRGMVQVGGGGAGAGFGEGLGGGGGQGQRLTGYLTPQQIGQLQTTGTVGGSGFESGGEFDVARTGMNYDPYDPSWDPFSDMYWPQNEGQGSMGQEFMGPGWESGVVLPWSSEWETLMGGYQ